MSNADATAEVIRIRAAACQKLVDQLVNAEITTFEFSKRLQEAGVTAAEAGDYGRQARARMDAMAAPPPPQESLPGSREATPEGLSEEELTKFRSERDALLAEKQKREDEQRRTAADEVEWSIVRAKLNSLLPTRQHVRSSPLTAAELEQFLGLQLSQSSSPTSIPTATLSAAPHLALLTAGINADPHIEETWKLRRAFSADKALDPIVDLFAALGPGYDHQDDPKEFAGEFSLVRKDHTSAKRQIKTESDWIRVFAAWRTGVCLLYPHRAVELSGYLKVVTDLFRAVPADPTTAIRFDVDARERYAKSPFHMDDRSQLNIALLSQMFRYSPASGTSGTSTKRSAPNSSGGPAKRASIACQNWNMGFCNDPCVNRRMHGSCSECGKSHRARDQEKCLTSLQAHRRSRVSGDNSVGASGSGGA
ncbi:hypothetical protein DFH07DRAFT_872073 [Mycena maculata]|uniref:Uncharacterized protein n=1 Tax=Mycena maculata TaxID=230809 RepID=A0AAD7HKD3_9AGAR|nr:hypothetical protein DFH07DRAFT_872073 [Mycena maculata]